MMDFKRVVFYPAESNEILQTNLLSLFIGMNLEICNEYFIFLNVFNKRHLNSGVIKCHTFDNIPLKSTIHNTRVF